MKEARTLEELNRIAEENEGATTTWHSRQGGKLVWIDGDEGTGKRLVKFGGITYGTHKWDRLPMEEAPQEAQELAVCEPGNRCDYHKKGRDD